jgi:hypothetical protein
MGGTRPWSGLSVETITMGVEGELGGSAPRAVHRNWCDDPTFPGSRPLT